MKKSINRIVKALKKELDSINIQLQAVIKKNAGYAEKTKILTSIKGVGDITAAGVLAALPEIGTLEAKQISALAGLVGAIAITLLYAISCFGKFGLSKGVLTLCGTSLLLAYLFYQHEKRAANPLFDIHFFENKIFLQANIIQLFFQMCHFGSIFLIGMYLQVGIGMNPVTCGLIMGCQALGAMTTSRISVRLFNLYGASLPILIGFAGVFAFTACILLINTPNSIILGVLILFIRGIFSGLCGTPIQAASIIGFDRKDVGRASALFNAGRQIAISLGVSISTVFIAYGFKWHGLAIPDNHTAIDMAVFYPAFIVQGVIAILGFVYALKIEDNAILSKITKVNTA